ATSNESVFTLSIAGAGGLYAGLAGAVSVQLLDVTTTAAIGDATINGNGTANSGQDVVVVARDSTSVAAIDGGLAIGAGALSGAVDVGVLRNTTDASIADGATVNADDAVDVAALQNSDVDSTVVSAAGGVVGIAAGVSVYSIGDGIDPGSKGGTELSDSGTDEVQGQLGIGKVNTLLAGSSDSNVQDIGTQVAAARGISVAGMNTQLPAGTSASVGNATITTGNSGSVTVASTDTLGADTLTGAIAGGVVGLGAGIGVVTVAADAAGAPCIAGGGGAAAASDASAGEIFVTKYSTGKSRFRLALWKLAIGISSETRTRSPTFTGNSGAAAHTSPLSPLTRT
ncbi:MAG TPA: hypothetical protein VFI22_15325, partial [Thermomicrobiales bacterium]|nr:hypothetical protein [Thermomicrobiales bacterium]